MVELSFRPNWIDLWNTRMKHGLPGRRMAACATCSPGRRSKRLAIRAYDGLISRAPSASQTTYFHGGQSSTELQISASALNGGLMVPSD